MSGCRIHLHAAALLFTAAADSILSVTEDYTATNWTVTAGTLAGVTFGANVDLNVTNTFLTSTLTTLSGNGGGVETFNISASAAASAINMSNITSAVNMDIINVTDGSGNKTITTSGVDAVRNITAISLANGGVDTVVLNNTGPITNGAAFDAVISNFTTGIGGDVIS